MSKYDASHAYTLDAKDTLNPFRDRFTTTEPELIYLNGNSLGRLPRATAARLSRLIEKEWGQRLIRSWNESWLQLAQTIGDKIGQLIGAQPGEVIIADSTSVNLYKLAYAAVRGQNQRHKILTDDLNFPSDLYILQSIAQQTHGRFIQTIPSPDQLHGPTKQLIQALDDSVALLSLSHTTYKSSFTYDIAQLSAAARENGTLTLWDLSHSIGIIPLNVTEARVDMAVGCTYKYLNGGPGAPAFLYVRKSLQQQLQNPIAGWFGQQNMFNFEPTYQPTPDIRRFQAGTPPILSLAAIDTGIDILLEAGINNIRAKSIQQTDYFISLFYEYLEPLGFRLNSPLDATQRGSHITLSHNEAWRINQALIHESHVLLDFREPNDLRFGIAPLYTSFVDLHTAVMRLRQLMLDQAYEKYTQERTAIT